jgi:tetratricopeptide (TPR) repeat protein
VLLLAHRSNDPLVSQELHASSAAFGEFIRVPGVRAIELGPLPTPALRRVLALHADGARIATEVLERVEQTAEGNPLLARELLRNLIATHEVERSGDVWTPAARWRGTELPQRLRELVVARLSLLDEEMRQVLDAASVDGLVFDAEIVAAVLGASVLGTLRSLQRLHRVHHLVTPLKHGFRFAHALFREVVYAELAPVLRTAMHRAVAEQLETRGLGERDPERLGVQWEGAGEPEKARPHLARAAAAAADLQQNRRAVDLLERAGLAPARLTPALALTHAETVLRCAHALAETQHGAEAEQSLRLLRDAATKAGDRLLELRTAVEDAFIRLYREGPERVDQEGLAAAVRELPLVKARGRASYVLGVLAKQTGDLPGALRHLRDAETTWRQLGHDGVVASALDQLGAVAWRAGDLDAARTHYEEAAATSARAGRRVDVAVSQINLAEVLVDLGRGERTEELLESACETLALAGARDQEEHARGYLARLCWRAGRTKDAFERVERALRGLERSDNLPACADAHQIHQTMLVETGRIEAALNHREEVARLADRCGDMELRVLARMSDAALHARLGDAAAADRLADRSLGEVERVPVRGRRELALLALECAVQLGSRPWLERAGSLGEATWSGRSVDARVIRAMTQAATALLDERAGAEPLERTATALLEDAALEGDFRARVTGRYFAAEAARRRGRPADAATLFTEVVRMADAAERVWWALTGLRSLDTGLANGAARKERRRRVASLAAALPEAARPALASTWTAG